MPSIAQSQQVNRAQLQPVDVAALPTSAPPPPAAAAPSPLMVSSLPTSAASFDQFVRQFYGRAPLPMQRILPIAPASTEASTGAIAATAAAAGSYTVINVGGASTDTWASAETPAGAINGLNATFILTHAPNPAGDLPLAKNGIMLAPGVAYTLAGNTITFLAGYIPQAGDVLRAYPYRY